MTIEIEDSARFQMKIKKNRSYRIRRWNGRYPNLSKARFWLFAMLSRWLARTGYLVVIVAKRGCGSSLLCDYATPVQVLCFIDEAIQGRPHVLQAADIPLGVFTLNEPMALEQTALLEVIRQRAADQQGFILSAQTLEDGSELYQEWLCGGNNKMVVFEIEPLPMIVR